MHKHCRCKIRRKNGFTKYEGKKALKVDLLAKIK